MLIDFCHNKKNQTKAEINKEIVGFRVLEHFCGKKYASVLVYVTGKYAEYWKHIFLESSSRIIENRKVDRNVYRYVMFLRVTNNLSEL